MSLAIAKPNISGLVLALTFLFLFMPVFKLIDQQSYCYKAFIYQREGEFQAALELYSKAIVLNSNNCPYVYFQRGRIYQRLKRFAIAEREYDKAVKLSQKNTLYRRYRGINSISMNNYSAGVSDLDIRLRACPDDKIALSYRGYANLKLGNRKASVNDFSRAIDLGWKYYAAYQFRGRAYEIYPAEREKAYSDYTKAIELNPYDDYSYARRGANLIIRDKPKEALKDLSKAIKLEPNDAYSHLQRGLAFHKLNEFKEAMRCFKKAAKLWNDYELAWFEIAWLENHRKNYRASISAYTQCIRICNSSDYKKQFPKTWKLSLSGNYAGRGTAKLELNDKTGAIRDFEKSIEIRPEYTWVRNKLKELNNS